MAGGNGCSVAGYCPWEMAVSQNFYEIKTKSYPNLVAGFFSNSFMVHSPFCRTRCIGSSTRAHTDEIQYFTLI